MPPFRSPSFLAPFIVHTRASATFLESLLDGTIRSQLWPPRLRRLRAATLRARRNGAHAPVEAAPLRSPPTRANPGRCRRHPATAPRLLHVPATSARSSQPPPVSDPQVTASPPLNARCRRHLVPAAQHLLPSRACEVRDCRRRPAASRLHRARHC